MTKPSFNDPSWDATLWSLWGLLYTGAESDGELKTGISNEFGMIRALLNRLGKQVPPLANLVTEWRDELEGFARTITYGEANDVLLRLRELRPEIQAAVTREEQLVAQRKKPKPPKKAPKVPSPPSSPDVSDDEDEAAWAAQYQNTVMGHSAQTAKTAPKLVKKPAPKLTPEQQRQAAWIHRQKKMADECDNCIAFGTHKTCQASVLDKLNLAASDGGADQKRPSSENNNIRIIKTREQQFWTFGVTHDANRRSGKFSVYRRDGAKSRFVYVSGARLPDDPPP